MSDYLQVVQTLRQEANEQLPKLRGTASHPIFLLHPHPTAKVCLLFHGFTAVPHQLMPLAQALFQSGYNVLVPVLPQHGLQGNWGPFMPPPLPCEAETYQTFALQWLQRARSLGHQIVVGGLSGGATLAAWLGLEQPRAISKTLLFAPYLGNSRPVVDQFTRLINRYQEWLKPTPQLKLSGYDGFGVPAFQVFLEMGEDVLRRSHHEDAASMFIVSSASDRALANPDHSLLFERLLRYQPQTWSLCFDRVNDIPYSLLTPTAESKPEFLLTRLAKGYINSDLTWNEVAALGNRMARGQAFPAAVQQLGLGDRVSPDLQTVMTMLDKQQFLNQQQRRQTAVSPYPLGSLGHR